MLKNSLSLKQCGQVGELDEEVVENTQELC